VLYFEGIESYKTKSQSSWF